MIKTITMITMSDYTQYGEHHGKKCPICETITDEVGDLNNPAILVSGEKICDDCKKDLREIVFEKRKQNQLIGSQK